ASTAIDRALHASPTRRSSDLVGPFGAARQYEAIQVAHADTTTRCCCRLARSHRFLVWTTTRDCGVGGETSTSGPSNRETRRSVRSEEHTSELQSRENLVCRLL